MKTSLFPAARVTVSSKGQFTVPKPIREQLGMVPGTHVELTLAPDGFALRVRRRIKPNSRKRMNTATGGESM